MATANNMQYIQLGKSGLKVSRIILGCMSYGHAEWGPWVISDEAEAIEHIKTAYDLGINTFDTSNSYSNGQSEILLGKAIKQHNLPRDEIVVLTKVWSNVGRTKTATSFNPDELDKERYVNQYGLSRKHIFESVKHSLERLQLDYVDVLQCHRFDKNTPIEETMQALHDVVQAGYARYIGMSSCWAWQFCKMQSYAREKNLTQFISVQNIYNPIYREEEREMIPLLKDMGIGMIPWSPLAGGRVARPLKRENKTKREYEDIQKVFFDSQCEKSPWLIAIIERIEAIAQTHQASMAQVSLAWSLSKDFGAAPIVGTTSMKQLRDSIAAVNLKLTADEIRQIDDLYEVLPVFGHR